MTQMCLFPELEHLETDMSKYAPLGDYLASTGEAEIETTFEEVEGVLGLVLPPAARRHRGWWSNNPDNNVMTRVWLDAGYETGRVDMATGRLAFIRIEDREPSASAEAGSRTGPHPLFGLLKGSVASASGVDLSKPVERRRKRS